MAPLDAGSGAELVVLRIHETAPLRADELVAVRGTLDDHGHASVCNARLGGRADRGSVGDVEPGGDLGWVEPHEEFAGYTVAFAVLFGPICPHIAAADQRREASHLVAVI